MQFQLNTSTIAKRRFPFLELVRQAYIALALAIGCFGFLFFLSAMALAYNGVSEGFGLIIQLGFSLGILFVAVCSAAMGELIRLAICIEANTRGK